MEDNQPAPTTGFPENPDREKRLDQLKILVDRHNFLVDQVSALKVDFEKKDEYLKNFKELLREDIKQQKEALQKNKSLISEVEKIKRTTSIDFKNIVKTPTFQKLEKRINSLEYENFITRDEFNRKFKHFF